MMLKCILDGASDSNLLNSHGSYHGHSVKALV